LQLSPITLDDVAAHAGVSPKTVSRVLNNEPNVRATTREAVLAASLELGYRPNRAARTLAGSRSFLIGHLHGRADRDYILSANEGIHAACFQHGYVLLPEPLLDPNDGFVVRLQQFLQTAPVDGVILTPPLTDHEPLLAFLKARNIPIVSISPEKVRKNIASVYIDEKEAAKAMTRHLMSLGHEKIGFIAGPDDHGASQLRTEGFLEVITQGGLDVSQCPQDKGNFTLKSGALAAERIFETDPDITAIFAANDAMAAGAMTSAFKRGLSVPDDISIAGFDASPLGEVLWPALTTIQQPVASMAKAATLWLISGALARTEDPLRERFDFDLIVRASTSVPRCKRTDD